MKIFIASLFSLLFFSSAFAQNTINEQGFLSVSIMKNEKIEASLLAIVGNGPSHHQTGKSTGHAQFICLPSGRELKSVMLFSGFALDTEKEGNDISLKIAAWSVKDQDEMIKNLKGDDCQNLGPHQIQLLNKIVKVPFVSTSSPRSMDLGDGYTLLWSLVIQNP